MKVALGQFAVQRDWQENAITCQDMMDQASRAGADLLVLPEAVLATDITNPDFILEAAQSPDGPFLSQLLSASKGHGLTTVLGMHMPGSERKVFNVLVVRWQDRGRIPQAASVRCVRDAGIKAG